jgi:hypothetical protein
MSADQVSQKVDKQLHVGLVPPNPVAFNDFADQSAG